MSETDSFPAGMWGDVFGAVVGEAPDVTDGARCLSTVAADALTDPQVLLAGVRDSGGRVVDFLYLEVNRAACAYLGLSREELLGHRLMETSPGIAEAGLLADYGRCLDTGEPLEIDDFTYDNEVLADTRRYDIRVSRARPNAIALTWRDVTDRFPDAQLITASERKYRLLAENARDVVIHVREGNIVWVSPSVNAVLGAPDEHWLGRQILELSPPDDVPAFARRMAVLASGGTLKERVRVVSVDGVTRWVGFRAEPFCDEAGHPDGFIAALRAIDDKVAAEQAVAEARRLQNRSDSLYRRSIESAAVGICLADPEGNFVEVNDALCQFFGYDADSLRHKTWQDLTAADYLEADLDKRAQVVAGEIESYRMVKKFIHADGRPIWGDLVVSCVRGDDGQVEIFLGQITDITAQKEADERNRTLSEVIARQTERLTAELRSAAAYVSSILPGDIAGPVRVTARYLPSQELAGDSYDYRWIDDDHLFVYLIDVSGHGVGPALLSVSVHNMLRSGSLPLPTLLAPDVVLGELNRRFQMDKHDGNYLTMWCGVYEVSTRTLRYANAGAPPPFAVTPDATRATQLTTDGQPLGMFDDTAYSSRTYTVPVGCRILIYSDGAYEFALDHGHGLSLADFNKLFSRLAGSPLDDLVETLRGLTPSGTFDDDCTLVKLEFD